MRRRLARAADLAGIGAERPGPAPGRIDAEESLHLRGRDALAMRRAGGGA